jgi:N-methylhydantoinase B
MIHETVQPIEIIESEFPVIIRAFDIRTDSAGAGAQRGGIGYVKEYEVREPAHFMSRLSQRKFGANGAAGGGKPLLSRAVYNPGRADERALRALDLVELQPGDVLRVEQSGGAGLGNPALRNSQKLLDDVADGYVSVEAAERDYGRVVRRDSGGHWRIEESA